MVEMVWRWRLCRSVEVTVEWRQKWCGGGEGDDGVEVKQVEGFRGVQMEIV